MAIQIQIRTELHTALLAYNTSSAYEGEANAFNLVQKYGDIQLKKIRTAVAGGCGLKNMNERTMNTAYIQFNSAAWAHLLDDLLTNFASDVNAQLILPFLVPKSNLDLANFSLTSLITADARGGINYPFALVPNFTAAFFQFGNVGLKEGLWGNDDSSASVALKINVSNSLEGAVASNYNSKEFQFKLLGADYSQKQDAVTASVTNGAFTYTCTPAAGSYTGGYVEIFSMLYAVASDSEAFSTSLNLAYLPGFVSSIAIGYVSS